MNQFRIGIDGRELADGIRTGIGRYVMEALRAASLHGRNCIVYGDWSSRGDLALAGVSLQSLKSSWTFWADQIVLPRRLKRDRISVFLSPYYKAPLRASCPVVITVHDLLFIEYLGHSRPIYDRMMTGMARLYAARATAIVTDSVYARRTILERLRVSPSKVRVIPLAVGDQFRPRPVALRLLERYGITQPYLLSVSNFLPHKNLQRLVQAYAALESSLRDRYQLVLAGHGSGRAALIGRVTELGLKSQILFPGWIDEADMAALYSTCTACVLPSLVEGFGLPALEAMACGVPVTASNRTAIPEVVGEAGLLFDPEDIRDMMNSLARLLTEPDLRAMLVQRGLKRAEQFSGQQTAERLIALLDEVGKVGLAA
jgi:glycosyltransferase involved in cell wall biosynthesis